MERKLGRQWRAIFRGVGCFQPGFRLGRVNAPERQKCSQEETNYYKRWKRRLQNPRTIAEPFSPSSKCGCVRYITAICFRSVDCPVRGFFQIGNGSICLETLSLSGNINPSKVVFRACLSRGKITGTYLFGWKKEMSCWFLATVRWKPIFYRRKEVSEKKNVVGRPLFA